MTDLIVFSHLRWSVVYQRPQHLVSRLARHHPVLFIEEPVHTHGEARLERTAAAPNVEVLTPHTPLGTCGFDDAQLSMLKSLLAGFLRERGPGEHIAWFYTPMAVPLLDELQPRVVVYDCMDELSALPNAPPQLQQREAALFERADLVLTGGPASYEAKRRLHAKVQCLPSAVDADHFSPQRLKHNSDEAKEAAHLQAHIRFPRLGYCGVIDERLDLRLIADLADARPFTQIVMVGPVVKIDPASLPRRANIHWLGLQPYALLPYLMAPWDVCLMPFALNDATRFISPTKTLAYMAAEKPVVSTAVRDVALLYGEVVRIARDTAGFVAACDDALGDNEHKRVQRICEMRACVASVSWDNSAWRVKQLLEHELQKPLQRAAITTASSMRTQRVTPVAAMSIIASPQGAAAR